MEKYKKMQIAKSSKISTKEQFSGYKDIDFLIMSKLDDRQLFNFCLTNRYISQLCKDDNFWKNRFISKFGEVAAKYKPGDRNWKKHYLKVIYDLDRYVDNPWDFFNEITWNIHIKDIENLVKERDESAKNRFWLLNLGNKIKLYFPIDLYDDLENIEREYTTDFYFTPYHIMKIISNFYNEPVTSEELQRQIEIGNPYAERFEQINETDIRNIFRADFMGERVLFYGFQRIKDKNNKDSFKVLIY